MSNNWPNKVLFIPLFALGLSLNTVVAQKTTDPTLLTFGNGQKVTKSEFEYVYQKNNGGLEKAKADSLPQYKEYLDLYIKFKRKVMNAEAEGLDTLGSFKSEFAGYKKQLAQPYLVEKTVLDDLIKEAYERSKEEIRASHILIRLGENPTPDDTLSAYTKALTLRDSVINNKISFEDIAERNSEDPSAKTNKGDLGYFSAFNMVYPFETAAYNTAVGTISMPVRTQFGYHIIKVIDRTPYLGQKQSAHIIIRVGPTYSAKDTASAIAKINEIYTKLKAGEDFGTLASQYSDDPGSSKKGGDLGAGKLLGEMEEIKRKLGKGEISKPFTTQFGWHILKVTEITPLKPYDQAKNELKSRVSKDLRSNLTQEIFINKLKKEYALLVNKENVSKFSATLDKTFTNGLYVPDTTKSDLYALQLFKLGKDPVKTVTINDFINFIDETNPNLSNLTVQQALDKEIAEYETKVLLEYETEQLPKKYVEYRELIKEYKDGILLFTLTENKVWRKAIEDTTGLKNFYNENTAKFSVGERIKVKEFRSTDSLRLSKVPDLIRNGSSDTEIDSIINDDSALNLRILNLTYERGNKDLPAVLSGKKKGFVSDVVKKDKNFIVYSLFEELAPGTKTFEEARSECITLYQNKLETDWINDLEKKYPVKVDEKILAKLYR